MTTLGSWIAHPLRSEYAPIALFAYKRAEHLRLTLEALGRCPEFRESPIYVFCDGPRSASDAVAVSKVRALVAELLGGRAHIVSASAHQGLAASVIGGVTRVCEEYGRVIVLEDDLVVSEAFLTFVNAALDFYKNDAQVMQVSGHMFSVPEFSTRTEALFLPFTTSWGWATWMRAWRHFDPLATGWERLKNDRLLRDQFNLGGCFDYYGMLKKQLAGRMDSWAIRWYWSVFARNGLVVFPPASLVQNIGLDGSGTHGWRIARKWAVDSTAGQGVSPILPATVTFRPEDLAVFRETMLHRQSTSAGRLGRWMARAANALAGRKTG